jgi:hypothetical protein
MAGLFTACESALTTSNSRDRFFSRRDKALETDTANALERLTGRPVIRSAFEQPTSHGEHDAVTTIDRAVLVAESKASPPTEPFRDPDKSFLRIAASFKAKTGIQKAFEQGEKLARRVRAGERVTLYDSTGVEIGQVEGDEAFVICVTRDDFGPIATDLAPLLKQAGHDAFPWAIGILEFQQVADAWEYLGWGLKELLAFLPQRIQLHSRVFGGDELEYVGAYIRHGGFDALQQADAYTFLDANYSDWFDDLDMFRRGAGPRPEIHPKPPVVTDLRRSIAEGRLVQFGE